MESNKKYIGFALLGLVILSFIWAGKRMKQGRLEQQQALQEAVQSKAREQQQSRPAAAPQSANGKQLHVLSETFDKNGRRMILVSDKTKEQLEKEKKALELAQMQSARDARTMDSKVSMEVRSLSRKHFKPADVRAQADKIAAQANLSDNEKANGLVDLRNQIAMSGDSESEKSRLLQQIDAKMGSLSPKPFKGYVSTSNPDGSVLLTPK